MSKQLEYDHKVKITLMSNNTSLFVEWQGLKGRHDYIIAENLLDLDILISELEMAKNNFVRKKIIKI